MWATLKGRVDVLEWLLLVGNELYPMSFDGEEPKAALDANALVRQTNNIGCTPLLAAVKEGHMEAAKFVYMQGGALDVGTRDMQGRCPIAYGCINSDGELLLLNACVAYLCSHLSVSQGRHLSNFRRRSVMARKSFRRSSRAAAAAPRGGRQCDRTVGKILRH